MHRHRFKFHPLTKSAWEGWSVHLLTLKDPTEALLTGTAE